jgi:hypothetical protein
MNRYTELLIECGNVSREMVNAHLNEPWFDQLQLDWLHFSCSFCAGLERNQTVWALYRMIITKQFP